MNGSQLRRALTVAVLLVVGAAACGAPPEQPPAVQPSGTKACQDLLKRFSAEMSASSREDFVLFCSVNPIVALCETGDVDYGFEHRALCRSDGGVKLWIRTPDA